MLSRIYISISLLGAAVLYVAFPVLKSVLFKCLVLTVLLSVSIFREYQCTLLPSYAVMPTFNNLSFSQRTTPIIDSQTMYLTILTPDKKFFEGNVQKVTLPGSAGLFQVLKDHAPLVSTLRQGNILYEDERQEHVLAVEGGLVEVSNNSITVLIASADLLA